MDAQQDQSGLWLWELRTNTCRWPLGERLEVAEFFCGERTTAGCPYCKSHRQIAFTATKNLPLKVPR